MKSGQIAVWMEAMRLRTLPLSASVILAGAALAWNREFQWPVFVLCLGTTFLLQILSNLSNDLGDYLSGTDNQQRVGPQRTLQKGIITVPQMRKAVIVLAILSLGCGITLLLCVYHRLQWERFLIFMATGVLCIAAAIKYTLGKNAYGYRALGDAAVFVFFGCVGVLGSAYLMRPVFSPEFIWVAVAFGGLCMAVLNINNMRDVVNDKASGKNTLVVLLGLPGAKILHMMIVSLSLVSLLVFSVMQPQYWMRYLYLPVYVIIILHTIEIYYLPSEKMDSYLKKTALSALAVSFLFFISQLLCAQFLP